MDLFSFDEEFTKTLYLYGIKIWNAVVNLASGMLVQNPQDNALTSDAYNYVSSFLTNTTILKWGYSMLAIFFLFNMIGHLVKTPEQMSAPVVILFFIKLIAANAVLANLSWLCSWLLQMGSTIAWIVSKDSGNLTLSNQGWDTFSSAVDNLGFIESIIMCLLALVFLIVMISASINLLKAVVAVYQDLLSMIPFAALEAGTASGGPHTSQVGITYLKTFIGKCLAGALVLVMICISGYLCPAFVELVLDSVEMGANDFVNCLTPMLSKALTAIMIAGSVAGVDAKIKNFGL